MTVTAPLPTAPHTTAAAAEDRLRTLYKVDAAVTAAVGALFLLAPDSAYGDLPGWFGKVTGAVLLVVAADLAVGSRWSGKRLRWSAVALGELALAWVLASGVVVALDVLPTASDVAAVAIAAVTAFFGISYLRLARALR